MAQITINCDTKIKGNVTIEMMKIDGEIVINGTLITHSYIEEIEVIDTHRYRIKGVEVVKEEFGSNDFLILYSFIAEDFEIKYESLDKKKVKEIEKTLELYTNDDSDLWEGGEKDGDK